MSKPTVYRCIKDVIMDSGARAFTAGKLYTKIGEVDMVTFRNDYDLPHCVFGGEGDDTDFLKEHFVKIDQA